MIHREFKRLTLTLAAAMLAAATGAAAPLMPAPAPREHAQMRILSNGMRLIVQPRSHNRVLALELLVHGGSATDPDGLEGLSALTQRLLLKGTQSRTADQIAETIESVGGSIHAGAAEDYVNIATQTSADDLDLALELLADVALNPVFPEAEIEKERALTISGIRRRQDSPHGHTYNEFIKLLYQGHPYGHAVEGEEESVGRISRSDLVAGHREHFIAPAMALSVCGDVDAEKLAGRVEKAFAKAALPAEHMRLTATKSFQPQFRELTLRKDCEQAYVIVGFPAVPFGHPDYPALRVANAILGEGMSSRLFRRLRDERSLAYSVGSSLSPRRLAGHLAMHIGTRFETSEVARLSLIQEARALGDAGGEEFNRAVNYIIGKHLIARQSNAAKAHALGVAEILGAGFQYDERFPELARRTTLSQAVAAMEKYAQGAVSVALLPEGR